MNWTWRPVFQLLEDLRLALRAQLGETLSQRLDLTDSHCRLAREQGVLVSINSDGHRSGDFALLEGGVNQARRGWLEKRDVLNTRPLGPLRGLLKGTMG